MVIQNLARFSFVVHDKLLLQRYAHAKAAWVDNWLLQMKFQVSLC